MEARESGYFDEFPDELLAEILSRIQVKTLCKFRCVCKQWRQLISNPDFQSLHHEKSRQNPHILYLDHSFQIKGHKCTSSVDLYSMNRDGDVTRSMRILGSDNETFFSFAEVASSSLCRDLICMATSTNKKFYICNPSTQDLIQLGEKAPENSIVIAKGFGYDGTRDEYICIRVLTVESDEDDTFETFNFSRKDGDLGICNNGWRKFHKFSSVRVLRRCRRAWGIMVEGIFYWIVGDRENNIAIFYLDLLEENSEIIPPPPATSLKTYHSKYNNTSLVEMEGHVCMVDSIELLNPSPTVDVWMLIRKDSKNDKASWAKVYSIHVPPRFNELDPPLAFGLKYLLESIHLPDLDNLDTHELDSNAWRLMTKDLKLECSPFSPLRYASLFCLHTDNFFKFKKK